MQGGGPGRWVVPLVLLGLAGVVYFALSGGEPPKELPPPPPDAGKVARPAPLPELTPIAEPDASLVVDEDTITREQVGKLGLLGRYPKWIDEVLQGDTTWKKVEQRDDAPTWKNMNDTLVTFLVKDGKISGIKAAFRENAYSAELTALSWFATGNRSAIPLHWEAMEVPDGKLMEGSFELEDGRRFRYRGKLRTTGEGPWGPEFFELYPAQ